MKFYLKNALPESPVGVNSKKTLAENDEARDVLDKIWEKIIDLDSIHIQKCTEKGVKRKRKISREVIRENNTFIWPRMRHFFILVGLAMAVRLLGDLTLLL